MKLSPPLLPEDGSPAPHLRPFGKGSGRLRNRGGFTLVEALIAAVLGAFVIGMVTTVVVNQTRANAQIASRSAAMENTRLVADLMLADFASVTRGGVVQARGDRFTARTLLAMGTVCGGGSGTGGKGKDGTGATSETPAYLPFPGGTVDGDRVSGWGRRSGGEWSYWNRSWDELQAAGDARYDCFVHGGDTTGGSGAFRMLGANTFTTTSPGDVIALFSLVDLSFQDSALRPGTFALFRTDPGGGAVELVSGLTAESRFQYRRVGQTNFQNQIMGTGPLSQIQEVRVLLFALSDPAEGEVYERDVRILFRNVP